MNTGYYDVDSILSEEEKLPCLCTLDAIGMGFLDPSTTEEDLARGTEVEFPVWMVRALLAKGMVELEMPPQYNERSREQLEAGPGAVDLREKSPFYYQVGVEVSSLMGDQYLSNVLLMLFSGERFKRLLDCALNSFNEDVHTFTRELPDLEKSLFDTGYTASEEYVDWKSRLFNKLGTSKVIEAKVTDTNRMVDAGNGGQDGVLESGAEGGGKEDELQEGEEKDEGEGGMERVSARNGFGTDGLEKVKRQRVKR